MVKILKEYLTFNSKNLSLKSPTKFDGGLFLGLRYKKQPFYFQTPKLLIPFGISRFGDAISFSLEDMDINPKIGEFFEFLKRLEKFSRIILPKIKEEIQNHLDDSLEFTDSLSSESWESNDEFSEVSSNYSNTISSDIDFVNEDFSEYIEFKKILREASNKSFLVNFKIINNKNIKSQIYDENKTEISVDQIKEKSYGICIVQALGFWIRKEEDLLEKFSYGITFQIHQMKVDHPPILDPFSLIEDYSCNLSTNINDQIFPINNLTSPPPPPPLPTYSLAPKEKSISQIIKENKANKEDNTLNLIQKMYSDKQEFKPPSLDEILNQLNSLNKMSVRDPEKRINTGKILEEF